MGFFNLKKQREEREKEYKNTMKTIYGIKTETPPPTPRRRLVEKIDDHAGGKRLVQFAKGKKGRNPGKYF